MMREEDSSRKNQGNERVRNEPTRDQKLEADAESAAAEAEPMGSIAAAVPGDNNAAQDVTETGKSPGAESTVLRDQPDTTAGTEDQLENEVFEAQRKDSGGRKNAA